MHVSELAVVLDPATEQAVVVDLVFLFLLKITSLILAFLTIRMGFVLIREGAKGGFTFKANLVGLKADLASVSPGLLFVLLGICLMGYSIYVKKEITLPAPARQNLSAPPVVPLPTQ